MVELLVSDISNGPECDGPRVTRRIPKELRIRSQRLPNGRYLHPTLKSWPQRDASSVAMLQKQP